MDSKNSTVLETSDKEAILCMGCCLAIQFCTSGGKSLILGVETYPGATALILICLCAYSSATLCVMPATACFDAVYGDIPGIPTIPLTADRFTTVVSIQFFSDPTVLSIRGKAYFKV